MNTRLRLLVALSCIALSACGPTQLFRVRGEIRLADVKLPEPTSRVDVMRLSVGSGLQVGGKTSGEQVDQLRSDWRDIAEQFERAFGEARAGSLSFASGDGSARYLLQPEVISVAKDGDIWSGQWTETCVLFTLWDRNEKRMLERFSVSGIVGGSYNVEDANTVVAAKAAAYLAARFGGQAVDETEE